MVENCFPGTASTIRRAGGVNVWSKEGGGNVPNFGLRKSKSGPIQTPEQSSPLFAQNSVLPLGGCGDELALRLHLAFGTGWLSDSNVRWIGHEGFSDR